MQDEIHCLHAIERINAIFKAFGDDMCWDNTVCSNNQGAVDELMKAYLENKTEYTVKVNIPDMWEGRQVAEKIMFTLRRSNSIEPVQPSSSSSSSSV